MRIRDTRCHFICVSDNSWRDVRGVGSIALYSNSLNISMANMRLSAKNFIERSEQFVETIMIEIVKEQAQQEARSQYTIKSHYFSLHNYQVREHQIFDSPFYQI